MNTLTRKLYRAMATFSVMGMLLVPCLSANAASNPTSTSANAAPPAPIASNLPPMVAPGLAIVNGKPVEVPMNSTQPSKSGGAPLTNYIGQFAFQSPPGWCLMSGNVYHMDRQAGTRAVSVYPVPGYSGQWVGLRARILIWNGANWQNFNQTTTSFLRAYSTQPAAFPSVYVDPGYNPNLMYYSVVVDMFWYDGNNALMGSTSSSLTSYLSVFSPPYPSQTTSYCTF